VAVGPTSVARLAEMLSAVLMGMICQQKCYYFRQGGYVIVVVCLSVCLSVYLLATLHKNFGTDLHEIFMEGWQWAMNK